MHLNYFFLRALEGPLTKALTGYYLEDAWSQERDELALRWTKPGTEGERSWVLRMHLRPELTFLSLPDRYERARANTATLFAPIIGRQAVGARVTPYDRSLTIELSGEAALLIKLHGNRANVILRLEGVGTHSFKGGMVADLELTPARLASAPDLSREAFEAQGQDPYKVLPMMGPETRAWLDRQEWAHLDSEAKWALWQRTLHTLHHPEAFYLTQWQGRTQLLLWPLGEIEETVPDAWEALKQFGKLAGRRHYLEAAKREAATLITRRRDQTREFLLKVRERLKTLETAEPPSQLADLIMAHLHALKDVPAGQPRQIDDYYTGGQRTITLKQGQTALSLAQGLYRQSANRSREIEELMAQQASRESLLSRLEQGLATLGTLQQVAQVRELRQSLGLSRAALDADEASLPFKTVYVEGWEVRIGRTATANDDMLRSHSHKDDYWLHARSVPGSHVLVVHQAGREAPRPVLERAAELAAWHSRKRSESLADVQLTRRKYVRKVKGAPPGAVRVDREQVLLVTPRA